MKRFHYPDSQIIKAIVKHLDDVEGINADDGLFKIERSDILIRTVHVDNDVFNTQTLWNRYRLKVMMKTFLSTAGKDVDDLVMIEIVEDTGVFRKMTGFTEVIEFSVNFIDA